MIIQLEKLFSWNGNYTSQTSSIWATLLCILYPARTLVSITSSCVHPYLHVREQLTYHVSILIYMFVNNSHIMYPSLFTCSWTTRISCIHPYLHVREQLTYHVSILIYMFVNNSHIMYPSLFTCSWTTRISCIHPYLHVREQLTYHLSILIYMFVNNSHIIFEKVSGALRTVGSTLPCPGCHD